MTNRIQREQLADVKLPLSRSDFWLLANTFGFQNSSEMQEPLRSEYLKMYYEMRGCMDNHNCGSKM
ncbi:MAG: hypothetical protein UF067_00440 [Paludibacteraceae bacterium]|nr:hypothetical protein [Paludibacteraceae bacterium]MEE1540908.1 hypothetical protein [Paludibacteraceae bacterium]